MSDVRRFTLEEANSTLPYLRRVVGDLVRDYHAWKETLSKYEVAAARRRAAEHGTPGDEGDAERLERSAATLAGAIESYLAEIAAVGAEAKGFAEGLIDFPGERDGREIRWCWMLGESAVEHWHYVDAGFSGRQPVDGLAAAKQE